jgi:RNA polymerase sigma factor (TIGR02999 family)
MAHLHDGPSKLEVTQLLRAWGGGDARALDTLIPLVENELRRLAHSYMSRETPDHTLQTTALVNEAYLRLTDLHQMAWQDRAHFFAMSATMMRRILTEFARSRHRLKRGGELRQVSLDENLAISDNDAGMVALDEALSQLAKLDPRKTQVVELRFFGGLSLEETAEVLKISPDTVKRDWRFAKSWLHRVLSGENSDDT